MQKTPKDPQTEDATRPRTRGRPRAFDRDAALTQATHLFWAKGFDATSMSDLTAAMGIGSPSLYAAFGSKEALYVETLGHYRTMYEGLVWSGFFSAQTARKAVAALLMDSAATLAGCIENAPNGCMVALASVGAGKHGELEDLLRSMRAVTFERVKTRLNRAVEEGELPAGANVEGLSRFVQTVQNGMSILARDGATSVELKDAADIAMQAWDAQVA